MDSSRSVRLLRGWYAGVSLAGRRLLQDPQQATGIAAQAAATAKAASADAHQSSESAAAKAAAAEREAQGAAETLGANLQDADSLKSQLASLETATDTAQSDFKQQLAAQLLNVQAAQLKADQATQALEVSEAIETGTHSCRRSYVRAPPRPLKAQSSL